MCIKQTPNRINTKKIRESISQNQRKKSECRGKNCTDTPQLTMGIPQNKPTVQLKMS